MHTYTNCSIHMEQSKEAIDNPENASDAPASAFRYNRTHPSIISAARLLRMRSGWLILVPLFCSQLTRQLYFEIYFEVERYRLISIPLVSNIWQNLANFATAFFTDTLL